MNDKELWELMSIICEGQDSEQRRKVEQYITDLQKEIERLQEKINYKKTLVQGLDNTIEAYEKTIVEQEDKIERLNNIINDFEEELERESNIKEEDTCLEHNTYIDINNTLKSVLKRFRELKGSDKE